MFLYNARNNYIGVSTLVCFTGFRKHFIYNSKIRGIFCLSLALIHFQTLDIYNGFERL